MDIVLLIAGVLGLVAGTVVVMGRSRVRDAVARADASGRRADARVAEAGARAFRLEQALDSGNAGFIVVDADGTEVVRNRAAERFVDARHSDAVAAQMIDRMLTRALAGEERSHELPLFGPPREVFRISGRPIRNDGAVVGAVVVVDDVTELRRVESVRRDFVANVSHELKTPIGALTLLAETVAASEPPQETRGLIDQLVREAERLGRIVDDLLDLSIIEARETPIRERVPLRVLLDEAVERVRALALGRGIALVYRPPDAAVVVACDPLQLVGAFTNLLENAVKYSEEQGSVEICTTVERDGRVALWVRDEGIGIPSKDLERVFERFYRVDRARSRATGGTGLGLSIVRHVAQVHGGEVGVESVEGEGSTFRMILPISDCEAVEGTPQQADS